MCCAFFNQEISMFFLAFRRKKSMDTLLCLVNVYQCCKLMTYQYLRFYLHPTPHLPSLFPFQSSLSYLWLGVLSQGRLTYTFLSLSLTYICISPYFLSENPDLCWSITSEIAAIRHFALKLHDQQLPQRSGLTVKLISPSPALTAKTLGTQQ